MSKARSNVSKLNGLVRRFTGGDPTGVLDNLAALTAAIAAMPAAGGILFIPAGTYKVSGAIVVNKPITIMGEGYGTDIRTSSATANIFTVTSNYAVIDNLQMTTSVVRTAGWFVDFVGAGLSRCELKNFMMTGAIGGVRSSAAGSITLSHGKIFECTATTGVGVRWDNGVDNTMFDVLIDRAAGQIFAAVMCTNAGDLDILFCEFIHGGDNLLVVPPAGMAATSIWARGTFFDQGTRGVHFLAADGSIARSGFLQCWMAGNSSEGFKLNATGTGTIDGTDIDSCHMFANGNNAVSVTSAAVINTRVRGGEYAGNVGAAFNAAANVGKFSVSDECRMGPTGGYGANTHPVFVAAGTGDNIRIHGNDLSGNTNPMTFNATGSNNRVENNAGYNPVGASAIAVGASPYAYVAGPSPETIYVDGGTVSAIATGGQTMFASTGKTVQLGPNESVTVTYTVLPTMKKMVH